MQSTTPEVQSYVKKLAKLIQGFTRAKTKTHPLALLEQPFDAYFLRESPMFLRARKLYLRNGGKFKTEFLTAPRTLGSASLLEDGISYSPVESELFWSATDPIQKKDLRHLATLATYTTSLFHEQTHRILWKLLPKPRDLSRNGIRRYLNFVEALVVSLDSALGDELGEKKAALGYLSGVLYDPGSRAHFKNKREKLNYYHAYLRTTYLALERYHQDRVRDSVLKLHPEMPKPILEHAIDRALRLDQLFIELTNPIWQNKNFKVVVKALTPKTGEKTLDIPKDPFTFHEAYLWAEKVFQTFI